MPVRARSSGSHEAENFIGGPAVANGVVYVRRRLNLGGVNLYALDAGTGALLWKYVPGGFDLLLPAVANGVVYIGVLGHGTVCPGCQYRRAPLEVHNTEPRFELSPAVVNGMVYIGSDDGNLLRLRSARPANVGEVQPAASVPTRLG